MATALVIDTCGGEGYVAAFSVDGAQSAPLSERHLGVRATQEELLPSIESVLQEAGLSLQELSAVAVVSGPGSFTGVRIGLATAKGLCEAANLPLVALSRLQVLAYAAFVSPVWAWLQAGRGDVYLARFCADDEGSKARVLSLECAVAAAGVEAVAVCEETLRASTPSATFVEQQALEAALRATAAAAIRAELWSDVALSDALYLRVPDAELALRARQA